MKTVADLTFDDFRKIGKDAAEKAVADLRAAGHLTPEPAEKVEATSVPKPFKLGVSPDDVKVVKKKTEQSLIEAVHRSHRDQSNSRSTTIDSTKAFRHEKG